MQMQMQIENIQVPRRALCPLPVAYLCPRRRCRCRPHPRVSSLEFETIKC